MQTRKGRITQPAALSRVNAGGPGHPPCRPRATSTGPQPSFEVGSRHDVPCHHHLQPLNQAYTRRVHVVHHSVVYSRHVNTCSLFITAVFICPWVVVVTAVMPAWAAVMFPRPWPVRELLRLDVFLVLRLCFGALFGRNNSVVCNLRSNGNGVAWVCLVS